MMVKISYICGIFCALAFVRGFQIPEEFQILINECGQDVGITEPFKEPMNFDDPKVKCFLVCIMKKKGTLVDGKIDIDKEIALASKHLPREMINPIRETIAECAVKANKRKDECDLAVTLCLCVYEKYIIVTSKKQ